MTAPLPELLEQAREIKPEPGDYCLATKYEDGDPGDQWVIGFYAGVMPEYKQIRHNVVDRDGKPFRANGFRKVRIGILPEVAKWLLDSSKVLEASPPGTVNLWKMLTDNAFDEDSIIRARSTNKQER